MGTAQADPAARGISGGSSTGLGLDIVRRITERSGGSLTVTATSSGGAKAIAVFG